MDAVLTGKSISVAYHQNTVIPAMDVQIPRGRITSVIGPNGCGKSTLLKALSRMTPIREGHVLLDGREIAHMSTVEVARNMAILPQAPQAPGGPPFLGIWLGMKVIERYMKNHPKMTLKSLLECTDYSGMIKDRKSVV